MSIYDSKQKQPALHTSERTIVPRTVIFGLFKDTKENLSGQKRYLAKISLDKPRLFFSQLSVDLESSEGIDLKIVTDQQISPRLRLNTPSSWN